MHKAWVSSGDYSLHFGELWEFIDSLEALCAFIGPVELWEYGQQHSIGSAVCTKGRDAS